MVATIIPETPRERRKRLDHERYMRQRDERLKKRREQYHADIEKSRAYARGWYMKKRMSYLEQRG